VSSSYATGDTARCCAPEHEGPRVLPLTRFYGRPGRVRASGYCRECYLEWRRQKSAAARGEVAAEGVGPDFTALAEAELFPAARTPPSRRPSAGPRSSGPRCSRPRPASTRPPSTPGRPA
jgi:hypothetical protein